MYYSGLPGGILRARYLRYNSNSLHSVCRIAWPHKLHTAAHNRFIAAYIHSPIHTGYVLCGVLRGLTADLVRLQGI